MRRCSKQFFLIGLNIFVLIGVGTGNAIAGDFKNLSGCVRNIAKALRNDCGQPVIATYCFGQNDATKPCDDKTLATPISLIAGETKPVGVYHSIYYFACEAPGIPASVTFDGTGLTAVCRGPQERTNE